MNSKKRNYQRYLRSPEWKRLRVLALKKADYQCAFCGCGDQLEVHHLHYVRFGDEQLQDVIVLCKSCHRSYHEDRIYRRAS